MNEKGMIGYKAFNKDLTCRAFQYEIGKTYSIDEKPIICEKGFHFCKSISDTYNYYPMSDDTRICKVEALGEIETDDNDKYCTNVIRIIEEITEDWERKGNSNSSNSGYGNSGNYNSGNGNSGKYNSGDYNSGYHNFGNGNSGYGNSGYGNSGDYNSGKYNSGKYNSGNGNSGKYNSGKYNSGEYNSGYHNSGNGNSGKYNSGDYNSGCYNSGYYNLGRWNSGVFNTEENPKIKMFDKESEWTMNDWVDSKAHAIIMTCPYTYYDFINKENMTDAEKEEHPEYKTLGGYIKIFYVTEKDKEDWWNNLSENDKDIIKVLPNFDFDKFRKCVGF